MSLKSSRGHNIDFHLLHHQGLLWQHQACLLSNGTFARPNGVTTLLWRINLQRLCCHLIHLMWMQLTRTCNTIKKAAKKTIPCRYQNNFILCWDAECESLYKTFLQSPQGDYSSLAATALLAKLDRKRRNQWSKAVRSIDFSHSSQKAWSILNNLTVGHNTLLVTVPFQPMLLHLIWLEMGNMRLLTASHLNLSFKKCLTFGGSQHQTQ